MDTIYNVANDKNVGSVIVYAKSDGFGYVDSGTKNKIDSKTLKHLFEAGTLLIRDGNVDYRPVSCSTSSNVTTVTYAKTNSAAFAVATIKSA